MMPKRRTRQQPQSATASLETATAAEVSWFGNSDERIELTKGRKVERRRRRTTGAPLPFRQVIPQQKLHFERIFFPRLDEESLGGKWAAKGNCA